jgi:ketosteroid isomerase-like protein
MKYLIKPCLILIFASIVFITADVVAQTATDDYHDHLRIMVEKELAFSKMSADVNTRDAFIEHMSDSVVTFGEHPRIGKEHLFARQADSSSLIWYPVYADISASHDFGYTFGPWEYKNSRTDSNPVATGHFLSVWRKENGVWRVALDIGIDHPSQTYTAEQKKLGSPKHTHTHLKHPATTDVIMKMEKQFIQEFRTHADAAYRKHITGHTKFFRSGLAPFEFQKIKQDNVAYNPMGGEVSPSGDMAYVYGTAKWSREETPAENQPANYVRVWKKDGANWKIVADLLSDR